MKKRKKADTRGISCRHHSTVTCMSWFKHQKTLRAANASSISAAVRPGRREERGWGDQSALVDDEAKGDEESESIECCEIDSEACEAREVDVYAVAYVRIAIASRRNRAAIERVGVMAMVNAMLASLWVSPVGFCNEEGVAMVMRGLG